MTKTFLRFRGVVALGMIVLVLFMVTTGVTLWIAQQGGVIPEGLWRFASASHPVAGMTFFVLSLVHLALNKKLLANDLGVLLRRERP